MAGPWEKYASPQPATTMEASEAPAAGPWTRYQTPPAPVGTGEPAPSTSSQANSMVSGVSGGIVEGIPIAGPYLRAGADRAAAFARSYTHGGSYEGNLAEIEGRGQQFKQDHPYVEMGAQAAGGVLGTLPAVAAAPAAFGAGAGGIVGRSLISAGTGTAIGAGDAAVRTDGDLSQATRGGLIGGGLGLIAPGAGQVIGRGVGAVSNAVAGRAAPVPGLGNRAANMLADDFRNAGGVPAVEQRLTELGPQSMLLDASPSFTGRAQGLAVRPETRETIVAPLTARDAGTNARLAQGLDQALGPAPVPSQVEAQFARQRAAAGPMYERSLGQGGAVDTSAALAEIAGRLNVASGAERAALLRARDLLVEQGQNGLVARADPRYLHGAKQSLDDLITYGDPTIGVPRGALSRPDNAISAVRRQLNTDLERQIPGYAEANLRARTAHGASEALDSGRRVLGGGDGAVHPSDFAADLARRPIEQQAALRAGVRADLDRAVGASANDLVALRRQILAEGDWNRAKLNTAFGPEAVDDLARTIDSNTAFRQSYTDVARNSQTAQRTAAAAAVEPRAIKPGGDGMFSLAGLLAGYQGAVGAAAVKAGKAGANALGRASDISRNRQLAELLAQGATPARSEVLEAMARRLTSQDGAQVNRRRAELLARALMSSQSERVRAALPSR